jgi:hypothetical protein
MSSTKINSQQVKEAKRAMSADASACLCSRIGFARDLVETLPRHAWSIAGP